MQFVRPPSAFLDVAFSMLYTQLIFTTIKGETFYLFIELSLNLKFWNMEILVAFGIYGFPNSSL